MGTSLDSKKNIVSAETLEAMTQVELTPFESARIDHFHNHPSGDGKGDAAVISEEGAQVAWNRITAWDGYVLTPPVRLPGLGTALGVAEVMWKDEGGRFGLGRFRALGGAYAVSCLLAEKVGVTLKDLMSGTYQDAIEAITFTSPTDGNYDESVRQCLEDADTHGRFVVSDTSHEGYREVPNRAIEGLYGDGHGAHRTIGGGPSHPCLRERGGSSA